MSITDRYASAVHASSLKPSGTKGRDEDKPTTPDILGAFGLADKALTTGQRTVGPDQYERVAPAPLAVPLARLLAGDARAVHEIVRMLAEAGMEQAWRLKVRIGAAQCKQMAQATLGWFQKCACQTCAGHGYDAISGAPMLSARECQACGGTGKKPFESAFTGDGGLKESQVALALWMRCEVEDSLNRAGPVAMRCLAPKLEV